MLIYFHNCTHPDKSACINTFLFLLANSLIHNWSRWKKKTLLENYLDWSKRPMGPVSLTCFSPPKLFKGFCYTRRLYL